MTEKDLHELIGLRMSIDAMRQQFAENFNAMAARVEALIPEDTATRQNYRKGHRAKTWNHADCEGNSG